MKGKLYQDMMYFQAFLYDVDKLITEIKGLSEEMTVKGPEVTSNIQSAILLLSEGEVKANVLCRAIQYRYFPSRDSYRRNTPLKSNVKIPNGFINISKLKPFLFTVC